MNSLCGACWRSGWPERRVACWRAPGVGTAWDSRCRSPPRKTDSTSSWWIPTSSLYHPVRWERNMFENLRNWVFFTYKSRVYIHLYILNISTCTFIYCFSILDNGGSLTSYLFMFSCLRKFRVFILRIYLMSMLLSSLFFRYLKDKFTLCFLYL